MSKSLLTNGMKIGKATVIVDIVPKGNAEIRPAVIITPKFNTYHNTGNTGKGANAEAHNKLMHNMANKLPRDTSHVSWTFAVDENFIYQHLPMDEMAHHCGDGVGPKSGNMTSVGIEICMHSDQKNYAQAEENAIALGVYIAKLWNMPIANHVPHQKWSGKFCPAVILKRDGTFGKFRARIDAAYQLATVKPVVTPVAPVQPVKAVLKSYDNGVYTVVKGDTLSAIAKKHNTTVALLQSRNNITNASKIYVGQKIVISILPTATAVPIPNAPVTPPKITPVTTPKPAVKPVAKVKTLYLPKSATKWAVYPTNKAPVSKNAVGYLNPKKFGGLSYEILATPQKDVVTIKTTNYGKVNIYVAKSTGATIK